MFYIGLFLLLALFTVDNFFLRMNSLVIYSFLFPFCEHFMGKKMMIHIYFSPFWLMSKAC